MVFPHPDRFLLTEIVVAPDLQLRPGRFGEVPEGKGRSSEGQVRVAYDGNAHRLSFMRECRVESRFHLLVPHLPGLFRVASGKQMEMTVPPAFAASFGSAAS